MINLCMASMRSTRWASSSTLSVEGRGGSRLALKLVAPRNSESPGWTKPRRRNNPDGLVQRRISYFTHKANGSSDEFFSPYVGPWKL